MDAHQYIQKQAIAMNRYLDAVIQDLTEEQINWTPPAVTNSIGAILLHAMGGLDRVIHELIQAKPALWVEKGLAERFGPINPPGGSAGWDEVKGSILPLTRNPAGLKPPPIST